MYVDIKKLSYTYEIFILFFIFHAQPLCIDVKVQSSSGFCMVRVVSCSASENRMRLRPAGLSRVLSYARSPKSVPTTGFCRDIERDDALRV